MQGLIHSNNMNTQNLVNQIKIKPVEQVYAEIAEELALPPVKIHCSVLAEDAIKAAIEDYRKKQTGE